ncbi:hypothetical protein Bbelb_403240 [Branchiostoma belcheri]|nr:hypothetical protein Bbelb_403240 [Branchiostoma belcheri]
MGTCIGVCHLTCSPCISDDLPADNTCLHTVLQFCGVGVVVLSYTASSTNIYDTAETTTAHPHHTVRALNIKCAGGWPSANKTSRNILRAARRLFGGAGVKGIGTILRGILTMFRHVKYFFLSGFLEPPSHILTKPPPLHNIPSCGAESKQQGATVVRHPVPTTQTSRPNQRRHSDAMYTFTQGPDAAMTSQVCRKCTRFDREGLRDTWLGAFRLENGRIYQARSVSQWELVQVIKLPQLAPKCPGQRPRGDWDDTVALGLWVVDPHGYQAYQTRPLTTYEEATANYPDRWSRLNSR